MILEKGLGKEFWAEAINTTVYILNRTGTSPQEGKTPYEVYFNKLPEWTHLRTFGCEAYVHIPKQKRKKWCSKSKKGILVGYPENSKGYKIYFKNTHSMEFHRDVIFREKEKVEFIDKPLIRKDNKEDSHIFDEEDQHSEGDTSYYEDTREDFEDLETTDTELTKNSTESSRVLRNRDTLKKPLWFGDYVAALAIEEEPNSLEEALKGSAAKEWKQAMKKEMDALIKNCTWELTDLPAGRKAISNRWIFKIKTNGSDTRYKARLVIKGCQQKYMLDYFDTFSPMVRYTSIRLILATAVTHRLRLCQFDVKTAFLNGTLKEEIYMQQPLGFEDDTNRVCKLRKSLYGLKQASKCWNEDITKFLKKIGLEPTKADPCVFTKKSGSIVFLALYVDDGLIAASEESDIKRLLIYLQKRYEITTNEPKHLLGMSIEREKDGSILIHQDSYVHAILKRFHMSDVNPVATPAEMGLNFDEETSLEIKDKPFREAIGSLIYLTTTTRPDLAFIVNKLSRYVEHPREIHWKGIKRIMRYLKGTSKHGIRYTKQESKLTLFSDADFANDLSRKSVTGFVIKYAGGAVAWKSCKQATVSLSTAEAEYIAAAEATKELLWIRILSLELKIIEEKPIIHYVDNKSAIHLIKNDDGAASKRTKHIDVKFHFIREKQECGIIAVEHISSDLQKADILTKPLPKDRFNFLKNIIGGFNN